MGTACSKGDTTDTQLSKDDAKKASQDPKKIQGSAMPNDNGIEAPVPDDTNFMMPTQKISKDDFNVVKVIGRGSFGKVYLVKKKDAPKGTVYAMKTL